MAAQDQPLRATDSGGGDNDMDSDGLAVAVCLCLLHDLVAAAAFLARHPLHAAYLLFFARHLLPVGAFFCPLLASTALLLAVLATAGPYLSGSGGGAEWPGVGSLGRTCGIAVAALCAGLRPDGGVGRGAGLVGQLCSFVLGPGDAAAVLHVGEIVGELCDVTGSCFVLDEEEELAFELPLMDGAIGVRSFLDHEDFGDFKDEIDVKVVISEDLKGPDSYPVQCCTSEAMLVQEMGAEDVIHEQRLMLSDMEEVSNGVEEKRLECDPVSVDIKKCEPVESMEIMKCEPLQGMEIMKCEPVGPMEIKKPLESMEIQKCEPVKPVMVKKFEPLKTVEIMKPLESMGIQKCEPVKPVEVKKFEPVEPMATKTHELVNPRSSIALRIKLWEAQVSGNLKPVLEEKEDSSLESSLENVSLKDVKKQAQVETDPCVQKCDGGKQAQKLASDEQYVEHQRKQEFIDVKECMHPATKTFVGKCSQDVQAEEESGTVAHAEQESQDQDCQDAHSKTKTSPEKCNQDMQPEDIAPVAHAEPDLQEQVCKDAQPEPDRQEPEHKIAQPDQELQENEEEVYKDVTEYSAMCNGKENALKFTSIAGRVHSRSSSENLVSEGSPATKEWKRTLACKLYEERMQLRLCRDRAVVEGSDNMDMLWEAYEVGGGGKGRSVKRGGGKAKGGADKVEEVGEEGEEVGGEDDEDDEEGSVRQLCCLQALKFSTRKMNFGGGKPSLAKISKVLKRMTALSRVGSRRNQKV